MEQVNAYMSYNHDFSQFADELEKVLKQIEEIRVYRDKNVMEYGANLRQFMEEIRHSMILVAIISDNYFESYNCLFELSGIFKDCKDPDSFFPVIVEKSIRKNDDFYLAKKIYWTKEFQKAVKACKNLGPDRNAVDKLVGLADIVNSLENIKTYFGSTNIDGIDKMRVDGYSELTRKITELARRLLSKDSIIKDSQKQITITIPYDLMSKFENLIKVSSTNYKLVDEVAHFDARVHSGHTFIIEDNSIQLNSTLNRIISNGFEKQIMGLSYRDAANQFECELDSVHEVLEIMKDDANEICPDLSAISQALKTITDYKLLDNSDLQSITKTLKVITNEHYI